MACSALIDNLEQPIRLEPFSKFPVVRDLAVDRSVIFENLKAVKAWVPIDGTYDLGLRAAHVGRGAGSRVSDFALHFVLLLHGGLPAVQ
jgi:succinate dehydrogenase/fumarate reductase-like Fe-S protein